MHTSNQSSATPPGLRVNIGCGQSPTPGWVNFDNSPTVRMGRVPGAVALLRFLGLLSQGQSEFAAKARREEIRWADAARHIPLRDGEAVLLYSSHMLEHLSRPEAEGFLAEARRVLRPGGWIRIAVPDLRKLVDDYLRSGDCDSFVSRLLLAGPKPETMIERVQFLFSGPRNHQWMYDGPALIKLLENAGFEEVQGVPPGTSRIAEPGPLNLSEREAESVYVEARRPAS